jgi:sigma-E factor negative regulatory protein RseB
MRARKVVNAAARRRRRVAASAVAALAALLAASAASAASAEDAVEWLQRAATAAQQLDYAGTLIYQHGSRVETTRLLHLVSEDGEHEKIINLDGPPREVVRNGDRIRCYYPEAKIVRVESQRSRNTFPSLLPQQQNTLATFYLFRKAEAARIAGLETQAVVFEPKDGLRYEHKLWADAATGLLIKAQLLNEQGIPIEQFAFTDIQIGIKIDRDAVRPTYRPLPPDWHLLGSLPGDVVQQDTGWLVRGLPPGFTKIVEGYRSLPGKHVRVAHLVFSDGLVAVSVFVEPTPAVPQPVGLSHQGGVNVFSRQLSDNHLVTVLGEMPGAAVKQIAYSVAPR